MAAPTIHTVRSTWFAIRKPISKPEKCIHIHKKIIIL